MASIRLTTPVFALLLGVLVFAAAGCGDNEQEVEQAREQQRLEDKAAELEEDLKEMKAQQQQQQQATTQPQPQTTTQPQQGPSRNCGGGVAAGPNTSCAFALNTAKEWVDTNGGRTLQVYSPATGKTYTMRCTTNSMGTTCTGGNDAVVYIP